MYDPTEIRMAELTENSTRSESFFLPSNTKTDRLASEKVNSLAKRIVDLFSSTRKGFLDEEEIADIITSMYKSLNLRTIPTKEDTKSLFRLMDIDKDGMVSEDDITKLISDRFFTLRQINYPISQQSTPIINVKRTLSFEEMRQLFPISNTTDKGLLSFQDIKRMLSMYNESFPVLSLDDEQFEYMLHYFDSNKDGFLNFEEFSSLLLWP